MGRARIGLAIGILSAAAMMAASGALAATPQEIYRDYADNGRLDGKYSPADLSRALKNAAVQQYGSPGSEGLPSAAEEEKDQPTTTPGTSGGTPSGGAPSGGTAGGTPTGGTAGGEASSGTQPVQASGGLPFTGLDLGLIAVGALGLILLGTALRRVARQRA
jgi:hypothetical protein